MAHTAQKGKLLAVIGDEDTVVGFMLGGIGLVKCKIVIALLENI